MANLKVWTIANQKGGVGKTTSTVTLGGLLASQGYNVLLVDTDPHGSLSVYFGFDPDTIEQSVYTLFQQSAIDPGEVVQTTRFERLCVLPSSTALATLDRQLGAQDGKGLVLAQAFNKLAHQFDFVLIDCPPVLGVLMVNALAACQRLIVPVQTEFLALKGLERMMRTVTMVAKARKNAFEVTVVPCMFDRRTRASVDSLAMLQTRYPDTIWNGFIPVDTQFREASRQGTPLSYLMPRSHGAVAYQQLLTTLVGDVVSDNRVGLS